MQTMLLIQKFSKLPSCEFTIAQLQFKYNSNNNNKKEILRNRLQQIHSEERRTFFHYFYYYTGWVGGDR